jgi:preprotein translocase subunit Sec61beta
VRRDEEVADGPPISPRAAGIAIGIWVSALLVLAFVVVPILFAMCAPTPGAQ